MLFRSKQMNVSLTPYSPLAAGRLSRSWDEQTLRNKTDETAKAKYDKTIESDIKISERVKEVADNHNATMTQIALAWQFKKGIAAPIIGATKAKYIDDSVKSLDIILSDDEVKYLEELYEPHKIVGAR